MDMKENIRTEPYLFILSEVCATSNNEYPSYASYDTKDLGILAARL